MRSRFALALSLVPMTLPMLAGCGGGGGSQEVVVDGSSTVYRISKAAAEAYQKVAPEVDVVVHNHGTGGGFGKYIKGETDLVDASRPAKAKEEQDAQAAGMMPWTRYVVGYDGITVVVNAKNDFVKELTVEQLKTLYGPDSSVKTWKDLDPSWPDRKIEIYSPDNDSGTFEFFTEAITGKAKSQRKDVVQSSDDNVLVTGVANDEDAIGYFGYAYYAANKSKLKAVPIKKDDSSQAVTPSHETILDKTYAPLSRPLFLYVKNAAMARSEVSGFVKYYLENVAKLAEAAGYVAPTAEDISSNAKSMTTAASTGGARAAS